MGDVFKEQIVKKLPSTKDTMKRVGVIAAVILISAVSILFIPDFAVIVIAIAVFGAYYLMTFLNVEYEYIFTNGDLDIDVIYNRNRRKRLFSGLVKDFEIIAHVEDKAHIGDFTNLNETKDYSGGVVGKDTYAFLTSYKSKRVKIIIEPNEMMVKAFSTVITPRKFFKKL